MTESTSPTDAEPDDFEPLAGPPRWVRVIAAIAALLLLLFAIMTITGGPEAHGPGRHGQRGFDAAHGTLPGPNASW